MYFKIGCFQILIMYSYILLPGLIKPLKVLNLLNWEELLYSKKKEMKLLKLLAGLEETGTVFCLDAAADSNLAKLMLM